MARVVIDVIVNAAKAAAEIRRVPSEFQGIQAKAAAMRGPAVAALAGVAVGAGKAISSASDLNETVSKSQVIFGRQAGAMDAWASGAAKSAGLSKTAALDAAAGFGDMFSQLGFAGGAAASMSKDVVQMSADLGSFNNLPTEDVTQRMSAAFRGEYDSLQSLIPNINAARVETEAMAATGKKSAKDLTAQEKASAVLAIVQKDGARAAGDFARTQGSAANQTKIAQANAQNLTAQLGQQLLPAYTFVVAKAAEFLAFLGQHQGAVTAVVAVVAGLAAAVLAVSAAQTIANTVMAITRGVTIAFTAAQWLLNAALTANPIGIIVVAIGLLVAGLILAWRNSETFRNIVTGAFQAVAAAATAVWGWVKSAAVAVWSFLTAYVRMQIAVVVAVLNGLKAAAGAVWRGIKAAAQAVWGFIRAYIQGQLRVARAVVDAFRVGVALVWSKIKAGAQAVWNGVRAVISAVISAVAARVNYFRGIAVAAWNLIKAGASRVWNGIKSVISSTISAAVSRFNSLRSTASSVLSRIKSLFSPSALINAGRQLIAGLASGISDRIGRAVDAVRAGVQKIKNLLPGSPIKDGPLRSWNNGGAGKRLMGLLARGLRAGAPAVRSELSSVLSDIASPVVEPQVSAAGINMTGLAGGGTLQQITVDVRVDRTMNPAEVGRQITQTLAAYKRSGGKLVTA